MFRNDLESIKNFISNLDKNKIYIFIPLMSIDKNINDPYFILSRQIMVTKHSNPLIICAFILNRLNKTDEMYCRADLQYF